MPEAGVSVKAATRDYDVWLEHEDSDWMPRADHRRASSRPTATEARPTATESRPTVTESRNSALWDPVIAGSNGDGGASPSAATTTAPPAAATAARRTVTIEGRGAEAYLERRRAEVASRYPRSPDRRRPRLPRHERAGFRPDRAALWAVVLCLVLLLVAATTSRAAALATGGKPASGAATAGPSHVAVLSRGSISYDFPAAP